MGKSSSRIDTKAIRKRLTGTFPTADGRVNVKKVYGPVELDGTLKRIAARTNTPVMYATFNEKGVQGGYDSKTNTVYLAKGVIDPRTTLLHEFGHAKDYEGGPATQKSWQTTFQTLPAKERNRVVVNRFNRYVHPSDRVKTISQVKRRLSDSYFKYMTGREEIFADGYSQFITNAKSVRSASPKMYAHYQSIRTI